MTLKDMYRIKPLETLLWWIACSVFAWPLSVIVLAILLLPLSIMTGTYVDELLDQDGGMMLILLLLLLIALIGSIGGLVIGNLQRWLLRTKLYWAADHWRRLSMIGGGLGALAAILSFMIVDIITDSTWPVLGAGVFMAIFLTVMALMQARSLRHAVTHVWLWIAANAVSGFVFSSLLLGNDVDGDLMTVGFALLAAASIGLILGFVMIFLFTKHLLPMQPEGVEPEEAPARRSVWDEVR